ncbi:MAG: PqqD family protein [Parasporobacterium sp.]|nr:PqqD family protein [Parasporobacterium sp.]
MKARDGFTLREVLDEYMIMPVGDNISTYTGTVVLNEVSAFVWKKLQQPVTFEELVESIIAEYAVDADTASEDLKNLLEQFRAYELIEE